MTVAADHIGIVSDMIFTRKCELQSCLRMVELLQPEWDRFKANTGHNAYVTRDYADHTSAARTHRKEIDALEAVLAHVTRPNAPNLNDYIDGYEDALEVAARPEIARLGGDGV